jgi:hypothetical protein
MSNFLIKEPRFVFIHIPRTGGTSIRKGVFAEVCSHPVFGYIPEEWKVLFSCAFIRNPFDRLVSAWKMFTEGTSELDGTRFPNLTLRDFMNIVIDESIVYDQRRKTIPERIRHHAIPQTHPFNCLDDAVFVGRYEAIDEDFAKICQTLGIEPVGLPRRHRTVREHYSFYFDLHTRALAEDYYAEDLAYGGYRFEVP